MEGRTYNDLLFYVKWQQDYLFGGSLFQNWQVNSAYCPPSNYIFCSLDWPEHRASRLSHAWHTCNLQKSCMRKGSLAPSVNLCLPFTHWHISGSWLLKTSSGTVNRFSDLHEGNLAGLFGGGFSACADFSQSTRNAIISEPLTAIMCH